MIAIAGNRVLHSRGGGRSMTGMQDSPRIRSDGQGGCVRGVVAFTLRKGLNARTYGCDVRLYSVSVCSYGGEINDC